MRICLVPPDDDPDGAARDRYRRLAELLGGRHETNLIEPPDYEPGDELERVAFASAEHRRSAALMAAIEAACAGRPPDYVEVADRGAAGLVPLIARRCGNPLLEQTLFGVRLLGSGELTALHDGLPGDSVRRLLSDLEFEQLRLADCVIWPGGDVLDLYRRYCGMDLPEAFRIPPLAAPIEAAPAGAPDDSAGPLRILYSAPLLRRFGALDLASACLRLPVDDWRLTMVGADTDTAPSGQSMRLTIETMFGGDPRLTVAEPEGEGREPNWTEYDLAVVPPTFAIWPGAALNAMAAGLPVLATPVGGLTDIVEDGVSGWLADGVGPEAIRRSLLALIERREVVRGIRAGGRPREHARLLDDPEAVLEAYERLLGMGRRWAPEPAAPTGRAQPLVTAVVPYFRTAEYVEEAVASLLGQTHDRLEVVVVNDGSFEEADEVLSRLGDQRVQVVTTLNEGESEARNLGTVLARGEYVLMFDSDNVLEPEFVERALDMYRREPGLAYVSCWLRFIAPDGSPYDDPSGYAPIGNRVVRDDVDNWDGDTLALLPRRLFVEEGYGFDTSALIYADWELYRRLREEGRFGTVIPEPLARYRVLPGSLQRAHGVEMQRRGWDEARGRRSLRWIRSTAEAPRG